MDTEQKRVREEVIRFFKQNQNPDDDQVHELAESLGINPHELETIIYSLLSRYMKTAEGRMKTKREVIATLLRVGRGDLAEAVAYEMD